MLRCACLGFGGEGGDVRETLRGERVCSHSSFLQSDSRGDIMLRAVLCLILRGDTGTWKVK